MKIQLTIVETIHYGREFSIEELNALCIEHDIPPYHPDGETGDITAWLQDEMSEVLRGEPGLLEEIEEDSGDVQGQTWEWAVKR